MGLAAIVKMLRKRLNHAWRLLVTGVCFAGFALGGGLLSLVILPPVALLTRDPWLRRLRIRRVIGTGFGLMIRVLCFTRTMRLSLSGIDKLRTHPGSLILANHPTLIDVVILLWQYPEACCVVKAELWKNPFHWGVVRLAGYIDNADPESLIEKCAERLRAGESLVIFPEGTRTRPGFPMRFLRGSSYIALRNGRPVLPVILTCDPPTLTKTTPWYRVPERAFEMTVTVLDPLPIGNLVPSPAPTPVGARRLTEALETYFTEAVIDHA